MRTALWIGIGWLLVVLITAASTQMSPSYVMPDAAVVVIAFLALRREPLFLALFAMALGFLVGGQALAPVGLHEVALVITAIGVYLVAGHLAGSGTFFFAFVCGLATMGYHVTLYVMLYVTRGDAGFSSWATALLIPNALATSVLALLLHRPMVWLDAKLSPETREGLAWR